MGTEMSLGARLRLAQENPEGTIARVVEDEVEKLPKDMFLWGALSVLGLSLALFNTGKKADAMYVGGLAVPILAIGLYKRMIPNGHDEVN